MRRFIFASAIYNVFLGLSLIIPGVPSTLGMTAPNSMLWLLLPGILAIFLGILLLLCLNDLRGRASIVYWEAFARFGAFLLLTYYGFFAGVGLMMGLAGIVDLIIGVIYVIGLPSAVGRTHGDLLLDRAARSRSSQCAENLG